MQPLILSGIGLPLRLLQLPKWWVFLGVRLSHGLLGVVACYALTLSLQRRFSPSFAAVFLWCCALSTQMHYILPRINMDSSLTIVSIFVLASWIRQSYKLTIALSIFAVFLRFNYLPVAGCMGFWIAGWEKPKQLSWIDWWRYLISYFVKYMLGFFLLFVFVDSCWYQRPTLATANSFLFNIAQNSNSLFGIHSPWKYIGMHTRENTFVFLVLGFIGMLSHLRFPYLYPSLLTVLYLNMMAQKQERFLYFFMPILCMLAALGFCLLWGLSTSRMVHTLRGRPGRHSRYGRKLRHLLCLLLIIVATISAVSVGLLRFNVGSRPAGFYHPTSNLRTSLAVLPPESSCLSGVPWVSWWAVDQCTKMYTLQFLDDFFPAFHAVSYLRFENDTSWSKAPFQLTGDHRLFVDSQNDWNDDEQVPRIAAAARHWRESLQDWLSTTNIAAIYLQGGVGISKFRHQHALSLLQADEVTLHDYLTANDQLSDHLLFYHLILDGILQEDYSRSNVGKPLGYYYDVPALWRWSGWWMYHSDFDASWLVQSQELWTRNSLRYSSE